MGPSWYSSKETLLDFTTYFNIPNTTTSFQLNSQKLVFTKETYSSTYNKY